MLPLFSAVGLRLVCAGLLHAARLFRLVCRVCCCADVLADAFCCVCCVRCFAVVSCCFVWFVLLCCLVWFCVLPSVRRFSSLWCSPLVFVSLGVLLLCSCLFRCCLVAFCRAVVADSWCFCFASGCLLFCLVVLFVLCVLAVFVSAVCSRFLCVCWFAALAVLLVAVLFLV